MRARGYLFVAICLLTLLSLAAAACADRESTVNPAATSAAEEAAQLDHDDEDDQDERREHEGETEGAEEDETGAGVEEETGEDAAAFEVKRGCPACHTLVEPNTGKYTLGFEAQERAEARSPRRHPKVARDGTPIGATDEPNVAVCLTCHAAGSGDREGLGRSAPHSLRDIAHPSHLFSERFVGTYRGNCMSCHNVSGEGVWQLLSEAVQVNEKGVPSPDQLPIPGLLNPSGGP